MNKGKDEKGKFAKGNKLQEKLNTKELRREAYRQYCDHISLGRPKKAWCFEHPELTLTWEMMERYIKEYEGHPEFDPILMQIAYAKGYNKWFCKGENLTDGVVKGNPSPQTYAVIMRNMHDWDKENRAQQTVETEVRKIINRWES